MHPRFRQLIPLLMMLFLAQFAAAQEPVEYELRFERPNTHLMEITIRVRGLRGSTADFAMPTWTPGWYIIHDYAKLVQEFRAESPAGQRLAWSKTDKQTWRVELAGATAAVIRYKLYGNTLAVDWTQYNDHHAHISGPATWMYLVGGKQRPVRLSVDVPAGWRIATGMERSGANAFTAPDFDVLLDSPMEIGDWAEQTFDSQGVTYHVVVDDVLGRKDFSSFTQDLRKGVEELVAMMAPASARDGRPAPFRDYWFLFHVWPGVGGGLEHLNSTQIFYSSDWDSARSFGALDERMAKMSTAVHEFFHAWNVKRLRPKALGPFDYSRENYTPSLWMAEGFTSYFAGLAMTRSGLLTPAQYLEFAGQLITGFERSGGRAERSLADASFDTWFWYGSPGPGETNIENVTINYYSGGQIVGHLLDLEIRRATNNQKTLDDWFLLMYRRHALPRPGFETEDAMRAASEIAGKDMSGFFRRYVNGKEPFPYEEAFAYVGIRVERKMDSDRGWLGASYRAGSDGRIQFTRIVPGGPAEAAGLDRGDVIAAVDGKSVSSSQWEEWLQRAKPGDRIRLTVSRLGKPREFAVTLTASPYATFMLVPMENATAEQKKTLESWLGGK